jgi:hypothetical protein
MKRITQLAAAFGLAALTFTGGVMSATPSSTCPSTGTRVYLNANGSVTLNGQTMEAAKLKDALQRLAPKPTVVCYSRANGTGDPPASVEVVLEAIMATRLPIGLFTDATFVTPVRP